MDQEIRRQEELEDGNARWEEVVQTTYEIVEMQLSNTAFDHTLAITLGVSGLYRVLKKVPNLLNFFIIEGKKLNVMYDCMKYLYFRIG